MNQNKSYLKYLRFSLLLLLFLYSLTSCMTNAPAPPFEFNSSCPHGCWLGVHPGITTIEQADSLLSASKQISIIDTEDNGNLRVEWQTDQMGEELAHIRVGLSVQNGVVENINFYFPKFVTIQQFIDLLDEPDEISIIKHDAAEMTFFEYILYYDQEKVLIFSDTNDLNEPKTTDSLGIVYLNLDEENSDLPQWFLNHKNLRQTWLGFGKIDEYLKSTHQLSE